jgi:hypothetical protein
MDLSANPFAASGQWYKGNLHTHSTNSDGALPPPELAAWYREQGGYDFLAITDHWHLTDTTGIAPEGLLLIPGQEAHPPVNAIGFDHHILCIGLTEGIPRSIGTAQATIDAVNAQGGLAFMAHPYWHGCTVEDLLGVTGAAGIEVFNMTCAVLNGKGHSGMAWDDLLARGRRALGLAVDDAHHRHEDCFGGWIMARAPELTVPAVVDAIRRGHFYASQGPEILDLQVTADGMSLRCSPVRAIKVLSRGPSGRCFCDAGGALLSELEYDLAGVQSYFRIEIVDPAGKSAWTNPFYLGD